MQKRYFWAMVHDGKKIFLWRFRSKSERQNWFRSYSAEEVANSFRDFPVSAVPHISYPSAACSEVRRIQRRIAAEEEVAFPVEVT